MNLEFKELSSFEAYELWTDFCQDIGLEHARQTYGAYWPRNMAENERVWKVQGKNSNRVGWVSLRPDPIDPMVWQASGVFSPYRGNGYSKEILQWSSKVSEDIWGVKVMLFEISNHPLLFTYHEYHRQRIFNKKIPGEFVAGFISVPSPGYTIYGIQRV